jgi:hypothetical protein
VAQIRPGHLVVGIAVIGQAPASADSYTDTTVRGFCSDLDALRRSCRRQPDLREAMHGAIAPDLARNVNFPRSG